MLLGDDVQAAEHDGQDLVNVLLYEAENVLVVPEVQRPLCYLPVKTNTNRHTRTQLDEVFNCYLFSQELVAPTVKGSLSDI